MTKRKTKTKPVATKPAPRRTLGAPEIAELYQDGRSLAEVARLAGCSPETARKRLGDAGVSLRPVTFRSPSYYLAKAGWHRGESKRLEQLANWLDKYPALPVPSHLLARTTGGA